MESKIHANKHPRIRLNGGYLKTKTYELWIPQNYKR